VNPNNGLLIADPKYPGENITALNTIYHSAEYPSHVTLPIVTKSQIPETNILKEVEKAYPMINEAFVRKHTPTLTRMLSRRALKNSKN
jgi:predicted lipid-binding transport protein (Tim44 family)